MNDIYGNEILDGDEVVMIVGANSHHSQLIAGTVDRVVTVGTKGQKLVRPYLVVNTVAGAGDPKGNLTSEFLRFILTDGTSIVYNTVKYVCVTDKRIV